MEKPRRASVEGGMTEVRKNFPVDRRISRNPSPEVEEENTRSQIPDDGEVVEPAVEDDVPGGSSIL
jgi:hypothetical protein